VENTIDINNNKFFDIFRDDIFIIMESVITSTQTVVLFDKANSSTNGAIPTYKWTLPTASFPITAPTIVIDGTTYTASGKTSSAATLATDLQVTGGAPISLSSYTSGANKIFYAASSDSIYGDIAGTAYTPKTPTVSNSLGGTTVTVTMNGFDYNQFVGGLGGTQTFVFDTVGIYITSNVNNTQAQLIEQLTISEFISSFGVNLNREISPVPNVFAPRLVVEDIPIGFTADGNNTITYNVRAGARIILRFGSKTYDTLKAMNSETKHAEKFVEPSQADGNRAYLYRLEQIRQITNDVIENKK